MDTRTPDGRRGWEPFSILVGGQTYAGAFQMVADEVQVVGDPGSAHRRLGPREQPYLAAQALLAELYGLPDARPQAVPEPAAAAGPSGQAAARPVAPPKPPNNLVGLFLLGLFLLLGVTLHLISPYANTPLVFAFVLSGWVLAVMAHEFAHAFVAYLGGDKTVRAKGYLSFDPRRYADTGVSLVIPLLALALGGIGFPGGAVFLRTDLMRGPLWRAAASLAGPAATLLVLLLLAFGLDLWARVATPDLLFAALAMLAFLQATALLLNLLPVPGLDGFNAIRPFLPRAWIPLVRRVEGPAAFAMLLALFLIPGVSGELFGYAIRLAAALGVPREAMQVGWQAFHFWRPQ